MHSIESELDRWIISRFNSLLTEVTYYNERYELTKSVRAIQDFVGDELSNWYVRRARRRYWALELTKDKQDAYQTLFYVMVNLSKVIAPYAPYLAEAVFLSLVKDKSVHLTDFPLVKPELIDKSLEEKMQVVIDLVSLGRTARNTCQIKVRQTLQALYIPEKYREIALTMEDLIKEEINVKEIKFMDSKDRLVQYSVKANFKTLGPKYGKHMKSINIMLESANADVIVDKVQSGEGYYITIEGNSFKITEEDLVISYKNKEGFIFESERDVYVALDINLTPDLIREGYARELVNKIQFTRKELDFEIMDNIRIEYYGDEEIANVINQFGDYIKAETLAHEINPSISAGDSMKLWDINGKEVYLSINKL